MNKEEWTSVVKKKNPVLEAVVWAGFEKGKGFSSLPKTTFPFWFLPWESEIL